jgi:uncharacterized membrane protein YiaA
MIAKTHWFQKRKYGGWGLIPKSWQGWAYIALVMAALLVFQSLPWWNNLTRLVATGIWILFLVLDALPVMIALKKDELETRLEAIAERNASWTMVMIITLGLVYQVITSSLQQKVEFDPFLASALLGGAFIKGLSYYRLERHGLK